MPKQKENKTQNNPRGWFGVWTRATPGVVLGLILLVAPQIYANPDYYDALDFSELGENCGDKKIDYLSSQCIWNALYKGDLAYRLVKESVFEEILRLIIVRVEEYEGKTISVMRQYRDGEIGMIQCYDFQNDRVIQCPKIVPHPEIEELKEMINTDEHPNDGT